MAVRRVPDLAILGHAEAGIPHYWIVEEDDGLPVVHVYELDRVTASYAPAGIFRGRLERPVPFPIAIDLGRAGD
ncbi:hypothetical protein GCM10010519_55460 [Streptomyces lactacystinicus]